MSLKSWKRRGRPLSARAHREQILAAPWWRRAPSWALTRIWMLFVAVVLLPFELLSIFSTGLYWGLDWLLDQIGWVVSWTADRITGVTNDENSRE